MNHAPDCNHPIPGIEHTADYGPATKPASSRPRAALPAR